MRKQLFFNALLLLIPLALFAQDSSRVFTENQFLRVVKAFHPVAKQAEILLDKGESSLRKARGSFDPKLQADLREKDFNNKDYYNLFNAGLKVPTWFGLELQTGIDQSGGLFLNPENNLPAGGLWYAGISLPVGRGLFIDQRRATLKQAKIFAESTGAERRKFMNDLYFEAIQEYWNWARTWSEWQVYTEAVDLAEVRFTGVVASYKFGNNPAIDTLEAFLQVQNRILLRDQAELEYRKATLALSNYLWSDEGYPLEITDDLVPPSLSEFVISRSMPPDSLDGILNSLAETHPDMQLYDYKLESIEIDRRLARENLKPDLRLNYNALTESVGDQTFNAASLQNYKWGFQFSFPLFLRKERGELALVRLKQRETELGQQQKLLELQNKIRTYFALQSNVFDQLSVSRSAVANYRRLVAGEQRRFDAGESSLFLVNSRELKMIEARTKFISLIAKYQVSINGLAWSRGTFFKVD